MPDKETTEPIDPMCESNTFCTSASGYSTHYKLVAPFGQLIPMTEGLQQHLVEAGYTAGAPQRGGASGAAAKPSGLDGPECPFCGSASFQNMSKKNAPYLKCADKACGAVAPYKDRKTGEWSWREDQPQ